jgi:hypothetical protein
VEFGVSASLETWLVNFAAHTGRQIAQDNQCDAEHEFDSNVESMDCGTHRPRQPESNNRQRN